MRVPRKRSLVDARADSTRNLAAPRDFARTTPPGRALCNPTRYVDEVTKSVERVMSEHAITVEPRPVTLRRRASAPLRLRLPYPARNALGRWRSLISMMIGVGIALSIGMTILGVISAEMDLLTGDYERSGVGVYVSTQGGKIVARLAGDTPGTIRDASTILAEMRGWPETRTAIGALTWTMERQDAGPRRRGQPTELLAVIGIDGDPAYVDGMLMLDAGRWLRGGNEVVVGRQLARDKGLHPGDALRLNGSTFTIVGIGHLRGFSSFGQNSVTYMDLRTLVQHAPLGNIVNVIALATAQPQKTIERIAELGGLAAWTPGQLVSEAQAASASGITID
jgi:ABC-type lipoprotein release transport system permease subunit